MTILSFYNTNLVPRNLFRFWAGGARGTLGVVCFNPSFLLHYYSFEPCGRNQQVTNRGNSNFEDS